MATVIAVGSTSGIATARASACALVAIGTIGTIGTTIVTKSGVLRDGPVQCDRSVCVSRCVGSRSPLPIRWNMSAQPPIPNRQSQPQSHALLPIMTATTGCPIS